MSARMEAAKLRERIIRAENELSAALGVAPSSMPLESLIVEVQAALFEAALDRVVERQS